MGVDEIHLGKKQKFLTVVSNLETGEPLWFGRERSKETLDEFFEKRLSAFQRSAIRSACVDMWEPFRQSLEQWVPECRIIYDKFHILQHALQSWIDQLRWQRLKPMEKLARMLLDHLEGILNYCRTKVPMGVVEAVNGNIKALLRRGRGYRDMNYLLLKAQRLAATKTEFVAFQKAA